MQLKNCTKRSIAHILRDKPKKCCNFMQHRGKNHHFSRFIPIYSLAPLTLLNTGQTFASAVALSWCKSKLAQRRFLSASVGS